MDVKSTMNVVFNDLQGSARDIQPALHGALRRVLDSGWYILGQELQRFEEEFASTAPCNIASVLDQEQKRFTWR